MHRLFICTGLLIAATSIFAQQTQQKAPPASPPAVESAIIAGKTITVTYSSPGVKGRAGHIFTQDGLISHDPHYPVWRAGANAATKLHTDADLSIGDLLVPAGDYTLFVNISDPDNWVLIVSKQTGEWGLKYDSSYDLGKVRMIMTRPAEPIENLKYSITGTDGSTGTLTLAWENHIATVPIQIH
jgi:hypothetical protein